MGFPADIVSEILADIFGNKEGPTFFELQLVWGILHQNFAQMIAKP